MEKSSRTETLDLVSRVGGYSSPLSLQTEMCTNRMYARCDRHPSRVRGKLLSCHIGISFQIMIRSSGQSQQQDNKRTICRLGRISRESVSLTSTGNPNGRSRWRLPACYPSIIIMREWMRRVLKTTLIILTAGDSWVLEDVSLWLPGCRHDEYHE